MRYVWWQNWVMRSLVFVMLPLTKILRPVILGTFFIAVAKPYWGNGVGQFLMETMIDWANHTPTIRRLELTVQARNERAVHLYQKFGFDIEGTKKRGARTKKWRISRCLPYG